MLPAGKLSQRFAVVSLQNLCKAAVKQKKGMGVSRLHERPVRNFCPWVHVDKT